MNSTSRQRSSGEEPVVGDLPSRDDSLEGHMPSMNPTAKEQDAMATDLGDPPGEQHPLESVSMIPEAEEPILGDPPSREDSLLGHMPSTNPAAQKQFEDAIKCVSGDQPGRQQRLERVSEGPQHTDRSQSRDGESAFSTDARQAPDKLELDAAAKAIA